MDFRLVLEMLLVSHKAKRGQEISQALQWMATMMEEPGRIHSMEHVAVAKEANNDAPCRRPGTPARR